MEQPESYTRLTPAMALNLAAPHTWPAAILPCCLGMAAAANETALSVSMSLVLLVIVILMQSAVNTFNDYYDYVKGTDDEDADVEATDAVLVYNNINPHSALRLAIGFLACAFVLGIYAIARAGWVPLAIALIGAACVVLYSAGRSPISYLPIGELVSGMVMGNLIPLSVHQVLTGALDFTMLLVAVPTTIGVALVMFTNNTCDIERDQAAGRRTLPVLLGRTRARNWYRAALIVWAATIVLVVGVRYPAGLIVVPFMLAAAIAPLMNLFRCPFAPNVRIQAMGFALNANILFGAFYCAALLANAAPSFVL